MDLDENGVREVTWRLLYSLRLRELRLESDETDRTFAVTRLRTLVPDGSVVAADGCSPDWQSWRIVTLPSEPSSRVSSTATALRDFPGQISFIQRSVADPPRTGRALA